MAWYEPTDGGVHNVWVEGDTLYLGNYQGGARALDISGELKGDLLRQGREISWILTADSVGRPAPGDVRLGRGGEGRQHLRAGHQQRALDPEAGAKEGAGRRRNATGKRQEPLGDSEGLYWFAGAAGWGYCLTQVGRDRESRC